MPDDEIIPIRKPRADAERNRVRLLEIARDRFASVGAGASLEEIARLAGVGIGTLYRHFPNRDALVAEVYRQAIGQLGEAATRLAAERAPLEALRAWMLLFVDYLATKKIMGEALQALSGGPAELYASTGAQLERAIGMLADNAVAAGKIDLGIVPIDLLRAIAAVAKGSGDADPDAAARRMVDIMIAGLRRG